MDIIAVGYQNVFFYFVTYVFILFRFWGVVIMGVGVTKHLGCQRSNTDLLHVKYTLTPVSYLSLQPNVSILLRFSPGAEEKVQSDEFIEHRAGSSP